MLDLRMGKLDIDALVKKLDQAVFRKIFVEQLSVATQHVLELQGGLAAVSVDLEQPDPALVLSGKPRDIQEAVVALETILQEAPQ